MNTIETNPFDALGLASPEPQRSGDDLGQEDFLELMIAQMKNQDPFKPMENGEFLTQMAQFSSVSGIKDMQSSLSQLADSFYSNQALQAANLVGHSVLAPSSQSRLAEDGELSGAVELPASTADGAVFIYDPAGELVQRIALGPRPSGSASFTWDGTALDGSQAPPGEYQVRAEAAFDGEMMALQASISKRVDSVTLGGTSGGLVLNLADGSTLNFADVNQIL